MTDQQTLALRQRPDVVADATPRQRSLSPALRWVAVAGALVSAVLYSNWLLQVVFTGMLPDPDEFISELAASDQPYFEWFRWGDRATALVVIIAAVAALVSVRGGRWHKVGWWAAGAFAVGTALDSTVWTMVCAPHEDAACAAREAVGAVPLAHQLHLLSSTIAVVSAILSSIAFVVADRRDRNRSRVRHFGRFALAAVIGTNIWIGIAFAMDQTDGSGHVGIAQEAELTALACWLIYVGLRTAYAPATSTSRATAKSMPALAVRHARHTATGRRRLVSTRPRAAASSARASARLRRPATRPASTREIAYSGACTTQP